MIYPSHFEEKIGFTGIRRLLEDACQTPMGLEYIREIAFSANPGLIVQSLDEALSFVALIESGHPLNLRDVSDLRDELDRIRVQGTVIEQEALFDMKTSPEGSRAIFAVFAVRAIGSFSSGACYV
jgi:DNA mismatch repair protein MutS2